MQTAKTAVATVKESALNVSASAQSGLDKTKAVVQEQGERLTAKHPMEKEVATQRKQDKIIEAEMQKKQAMAQNAADKESVRVMGSNPVGPKTGMGKNPLVGGTTNQGYGTGGVGTKMGTGGNPLVGAGTTNQGSDTGGGYS